MRQYYRWGEELEFSDESCLLLELALWEVSGITDDLIRESIEDLILSDRWLDLWGYPIDLESISANDLARLRQIQAFSQKRTNLDLGIDRSQVAIQKFLDSETLCRSTNELFRARCDGRIQFRPRYERVLWHATRKIASILGSVPELKDLKFRFGPGATTQLPKRMASSRAKLGEKPACSSELLPFALSVLGEMPAWDEALSPGPLPVGASPFVLHNGKLALVPKSAKEERCVMIEPSLNTMCQAGIGSYMATCLRRAGVDIRDQNRNKLLAKRGSVDGSLATIDLSSASDTVSTELVFDLLGHDWFFFLRKFRTGTVDLPSGETLRLEKFSSMGNGFTFPLETLIFYALAWGCCVELGVSTSDVSAYGDDIIIPVSAVDLLYEILHLCGFVVNVKKSYSSGHFRESCGGDYYQGIDVRPVYLKGDRQRVCDLFRLHNHYFRLNAREVCAHIIGYLHESVRIFGPDGYGDGHLVSDEVPLIRKRKHAENGWGGYVFDTFIWKPLRSFRVSRGDRVLPAYTTYLSEDGLSSMGRPQDASYKGENFSVTIPGKQGFNRISIYTFSVR